MQAGLQCKTEMGLGKNICTQHHTVKNKNLVVQQMMKTIIDDDAEFSTTLLVECQPNNDQKHTSTDITQPNTERTKLHNPNNAEEQRKHRAGGRSTRAVTPKKRRLPFFRSFPSTQPQPKLRFTPRHPRACIMEPSCL